MKKKLIIISTSIILALVFLVFFGVYTLFFSMSRLPEGELINEATSEDGKYTVKAYLCNGGATTDYAVRCELIINDSDKSKNIYWNYKVSDVSLQWKDNNTIIINGREIDLPNGKYDWRRIGIFLIIKGRII